MRLQKISNYYGVKFNSVINPQHLKENAEKIVEIAREPIGNTNSIANLIQ